MARAYCTADEVKRLLRTATKKVKTSESYRELGFNSGNQGTVRLSAVTFYDDYVGDERFTITFSDSTNFTVEGEIIGYLGVGSIGVQFDCDYFVISPSDWTGTAQADDVVFFISNSNVSNEDLDGFIGDTSDYINNRLGVIFGDSTNIPWEWDWSIDIPGGLRYAAIRLTAYDIFSSVLAGEDIDQDSPVYNWYKRGEKAIDDFIAWYQTEGIVGTPQWRTVGVIFKEIGIGGLDPKIFDGEIDTTTGAVDNEDEDRI
jgi:hypothetical protein